MGFLISKWWKNSIGIKPYSHIGYNISVENPIEGTLDTYYSFFKGEGDISQIYWGNSFSFIKNLSLGINASYLFGPITQEERVVIPFVSEEDIFTKKKHISGFFLDLGLQYTIPTNKWDYTVGMVYTPQRSLNSTYTLTILNSYDTTSTESIKDENLYNIPQKIGFGYSMVNKDKSIYLSADYKFEEWSKFELSETSADYVNSHRFSIGAEFIPTTITRESYFKQVHYMFGAYYSSLPLSYKSVALKEKGLSLGLGLPLKKNSSLINVGFEVGERGTQKDGLIKERYYNLNVNFTLKDIWFRKARYN
jgi:hypothetical protein